MRFINDDVSLVHDQREVPYSNEKLDLIARIEKLARELGYTPPEQKEFGYWIKDADLISGKLIKTILRNDPTICGDNVYGIEAENFMCNFYHKSSNDIGYSAVNELIGLHTFDNGITFYGFIIGGDSQHGVFVIIYNDGEHLRLYTPRLGNKLNLHRKEPLKYDDRSERYMTKYEVDRSTIGFNWNAMKIDILANFKVDYSNVINSHLRTIHREEK